MVRQSENLHGTRLPLWLQQVKPTRVPERCVPRPRRAIHDWEMKFSRAESCPVAFGFVTACRRVLEWPVTASRLASVRSARAG